jgi:hypothetical protein
MVLNRIQLFILVTLKGHIQQHAVHEVGDLRHTLNLYCGTYILIV